MRTTVLVILLTLFLHPTLRAQKSPPADPNGKPSIGLSLSGGGAKGFAHIGVLKVLDSLGVKVDYIAGTSMGAIVGGLYAAGYSARDIEHIVLETDFYDLIANEKSRQSSSFFNKSVDKYLISIPVKDGKINVLPTAISSGQKNIYMLKELFKNVSSQKDFSLLPIPFMSVATNLESGKIKIFEEGDLVTAIMASSAFPSLMDPVEINDSLYIDGALTMNFPSQPLKQKGMDIVIGVDLNQGLAQRSKLNSVIEILNQVTDYSIIKETENQYQYTDIRIKPALEEITATSYDQKESIIESGYQAALAMVPSLSKLPKKEIPVLRAPVNPVFSNVYKIDRLEVTNNRIFSASYLQGKMNLKLPSLHTYGSINKMIENLYSTNNFKIINYDLVPSLSGTVLRMNVLEDDARIFLKFGLHYDEVFKTGLLVNFTARRFLFQNSTTSLDVIVGDFPRFIFNYSVDNGYIPGFGLYASGTQFEFIDGASEALQRYGWLRNEAFIQSIWKDRFAVGGGLSHDYIATESAQDKTYNNYINPYLFIKTDSQNDKNFPTRGILLNAEGKVLDVFKDSEFNTVQTKLDFTLNTPVTSFLSNRLNLFAGFSIGEDVPLEYQYYLGGIFKQPILNFVTFPGYKIGSRSNRNILTASNHFQFNVYRNLYFTPGVSIAALFDDYSLRNATTIQYISTDFGLGYRSPFGPISLNFSKSLNTDQKGIFSVVLGHWF